MARVSARQRGVFRVLIAENEEALAVVVSCAEANALRRVVTLCELREDPKGRFRGLPTVVDLPDSMTGLGRDLVAIASPYTVPQNCLVSRESSLAPRLYEELEQALRRVLGWTPWPA